MSRRVCPDCGGPKDFYLGQCGECAKLDWREKFFAYFDIQEGYWSWRGALAEGYGVFWDQNKNIKAHRLSWEIFRGPIPKGKWVLHNCPVRDAPACVNPDHLWLGTVIENAADAAKKGYYVKLIGESNPMAKINVLAVKAIRKLSGTFSSSKIAEKFGISQTQVNRIINKQRWSWVS